MGFSLGTMTAYVNEHKLPLITATLYGSKTGKLMNTQVGIKSSATINIVATTAQFKAASCTFSASGTTSLTQRLLAVENIQVMETLCVKDLDAYYVNTMMKPGFNAADLPFEKQYTDLKTDGIARQLEIAYWQGSTASWDANLLQFNGWISLLDTAAASVNGNPTSITTVTGIVAGNVVGIFNGIDALIPAQILRQSDVGVFCGTDVFRTYRAALTVANLYHHDPLETGAFEMKIPGTNVTVYGLDGLTGTNRIFAGRTSNFYIGTDLMSEEEKFMLVPDQYGLNLNFLADFKAGVQVAFPAEVVSFKLV
jgi:hypothetical protein